MSTNKKYFSDHFNQLLKTQRRELKELHNNTGLTPDYDPYWLSEYLNNLDDPKLTFTKGYANTHVYLFKHVYNSLGKASLEFGAGNYPCHGFLNYLKFDFKKTPTLFNYISETKFNHIQSFETELSSYYNWLFDRSYMSSAFLTKSYKEMLSYPQLGYFCNFFTQPHNLICGMITSRHPWDYGRKNLITTWYKLNTAGLKGDIAFHFALLYHKNGFISEDYLVDGHIACKPNDAFVLPRESWFSTPKQIYNNRYDSPYQEFNNKKIGKSAKGFILDLISRYEKEKIDDEISIEEKERYLNSSSFLFKISEVVLNNKMYSLSYLLDMLRNPLVLDELNSLSIDKK